MTERRDGFPQSYIMHHTFQRPVCVTPGCHTFIVRSNELGLCLACQLDQDVAPPRMTRPRNARAQQQRDEVPTVCEQADCDSPAETYCPLCERFYCDAHDELVARRGHRCLRDPLG